MDKVPAWFREYLDAGVAETVRSPRARRARLVADGVRIRLTIPARGFPEGLGTWLEGHRAWVGRQAARAAARKALLEQCAALPDGSPLPGGSCRLPREEAAGLLLRLAEEESARTGLVPSRVGVRQMRTRWGSCSRSGRVALNWKLARAPEPVVRYVVLHELAHLRHLDHSRRFWGLVEKVCPGHGASRAWLAEHGWLLLELP